MDLKPVPSSAIVTAFNKENGIKALVDQIKEQTKGIVPDLSTEISRGEIKSLAYKVSQTKSLIDAEGKKLKEQYTVITNKIDESRRFAREQLDAERDRIRQPLTDWENEEKARKKRHTDKLDEINQLAEAPYVLSSDVIRVAIEDMENLVVDERFEEYQAQIKTARLEALEALRKALPEVEAEEAETLRLEQVRKEEAERQKREYEAKIAQEATEKANAEAKEREEKLRKQAELEKAQAVELAIKNERQSQAKTTPVNTPTEQPDLERCRVINNKIFKSIQDLDLGLTDMQIKELMKAIVNGKVNRVSIDYKDRPIGDFA